jgi:pilus assembly protein Flp/PilA
VRNLLARFVHEDQGQDLIEYSLLAAFIALVSIAAITVVGTQLNLTYGAIGTRVTALAAS